MCWPVQSLGESKLRRYQPTPVEKNPSEPPLGFLESGGPSTLQSCGRMTERQAASSNAGDSALAGSPRKNFQPEANDSRWRGAGTRAAAGESAKRMAASAVKKR